MFKYNNNIANFEQVNANCQVFCKYFGKYSTGIL